MEPLLFAGENAPEWAFSKRKGVKAPSTADLDQPFPKVGGGNKILITF
jgi:hypothetical protein